MQSISRLLAVALGICVAAGCGDSSSVGAGGGGPAAGAGGVDAGTGGTGGMDAGTVEVDAGTTGGDGGTAGGGGETDAGTVASDCAGLSPEALPTAVTYQATYSTGSQPNFCGLPIGNGDGYVALETFYGSHPSWTIRSAAGKAAGGFTFWHGEAWPLSSGFLGYNGSSTEQLVAVTALDNQGKETRFQRAHGGGLFIDDPNGGIFAVGHLSSAASGSGETSRDLVAMMFNADSSLRYGPIPLGQGNPAVYGAGVDLNGRAVIIISGGPGTIDALWLGADGTPLPGAFHVLTGFVSGVSTWFETSPLLDGNLALRRMDSSTGGSSDERRTSKWVAVLPSGVARSEPAPSWLTSRPDTNLRLARSRRAYAFLPWAADVSTCDQQVEVVSPSGTSCGRADFPVDAKACRTRELRLGLDGTVMQMLPDSREQNQPPGSTVFTCTLRYWPAALR